jgi:uncharacterized repeat protein (TIGR01451 family)
MKTPSIMLRASLAAIILPLALLASAACTTGPQGRGVRGDVPRDESQAVVVTPAPARTTAAPAPAPAPRGDGHGRGRHYRPSAGPNMNVTALAFPTGDVHTSSILLHQVLPREVRLNQNYDYEIHVTNITDTTLQNVAVFEEDLENLTIVSSTPSASRGPGGGAQWLIGDLGPGDTSVIKVTARAERVGTSTTCLSVSFNNYLCAVTNVVNPELRLVKTAPATVLLCDNIVLRYVVSNPGTGTLDNVRITGTLPTGLRTLDGASSIDIAVGTLAAGEEKPFNVPVKAERTGRFEGLAAANSGDLRVESNRVATVVNQPVLEITSECTDRVFLGRNITYTFTVRNTSDTVAAGTVLTASIPSGGSFVSADRNGGLVGNSARWTLGTLNAGQSQTVSMVIRPTGVGDLTSNAQAMAECAEQVASSCGTAVAGIPAILLETVDVTDPVPVGETTTYVITVTNQGSADGTGIRLVSELPAEMEFVSGEGPTAVTISGNRITMAPLATLAPRAKAEWMITVRARRAGDVRFKTSLTSDQFERPIEETEATFLYD